MMFYDFTYVYLVNVNNALELANQSKYYIAIWCNKSLMDTWCFYDREQQGNVFFFYKYINLSQPSCHNVSGTLIFASKSPLLVLFSSILNREAHPILTNMCVCMAFAVFYMYSLLSCLNW